jgi:tetratricopeptide (TPR) repeat protein
MKNFLTVVGLCLTTATFANAPTDSAQYFFAKGIEEKAAKHYMVAANYFEKAIGFNKSYAEAYIENAKVNVEMRRVDQAKANFAKAYELQPNNMEVIKELATMYYDFRQWDKAIELANKCTSCNNTDRIIGMCHYKKESYADAEKYLLKALAKDPNDAQANYTLARNYMEMEAERRAVPYFEKAVALNPEKSTWAYELGLLYYNNNNFKAAVLAYENAAKNGYAVNNDFNENYGYALIYSGDFAKGEEKMLDIYKKKGNKELLRELATILYDLKQYNRTLDYCQKLLESNPKDGKALYQAGLAFIKLGNKNKGQAMCDKAIELDPSLAGKKTATGTKDDFGL